MSLATIRKPLFVAIASVVSFAGLSCAANAANDTPQVKVNYSDLDLDDAAQAERLYQRLRAAADRVCDVYSSRDLRRLALKQQCTTQALETAVLTVNHPNVLALHAREDNVRVAQGEAKEQPRG